MHRVPTVNVPLNPGVQGGVAGGAHLFLRTSLFKIVINFDVRRAGRAPIPGSTIDLQRQRAAQAQQIPEVPLDIEVNYPQASSAPAGNSFSGQWRVMIDGEEVWRFRGVGNNQADANRIAQTWLQDQRRQGSLSPAPGADIEVLPVMI
ncbi:MAG: hypothetical protein EBU08_06695 [Micrococcales bacterium]|nr:hypothetical protein [Micrococcales bacterium]